VFTETLTGFKHMGNEADRLIKAGETVLFAFEEAIGFMCGSAVLDKVRNKNTVSSFLTVYLAM
jgi:phosphoglucomutase/phosphopentomutase